ncbi:MAG: hypothetical protein F6K48_20445 [Okeania sp. SIO3H1]|uniref:hypothetical protein n=1 Tax=Okeania sp. SIO1I7 TaxID=2607772 RepID=UPI0013CAD040|nr:hypothetical protein [Okeania sp. SIO1I7]NEN91144.1 hypothetical protein [Okeania sp. SIO3H1]NET28774.1 hypothetical protein [Okeania sp. SIO1I7]
MSINNRLSSTYSQASSPQKSEKIVGSKRKYRRYNWIFLLSVFLPVVTVGVFNIIVDPYDVFNTPNFLGINHSKPRKDNSDRLFKATDIIRMKPVTVLLGSSRTKRALDPNHPALENHQPAYNLALNSINSYEVRRYLEHAIANQKQLGLVIVSLDFFMFRKSNTNEANFSEQRLEKKHIYFKDLIDLTFSLDVLSASKETIIDSKKTLPEQLRYGEKNGFMPKLNLDRNEIESRFKKYINVYYKSYTEQYQLSNQYLDELKKIVDLCQENQIKLMLFISPSHATQWEAIRSSGKWSIFEDWKRKVVEITPVFDFSGYNNITTEPISNDMKNYTDNSYYTKEVGNLVLNKLLSYKEEEVLKDFGILINPENIESHLAKIRQEREIWAKNNPDEVKLVQEIKQKYDASLN